MPILGTEMEYAVTAPTRPDADPEELAAAVVEYATVAAMPFFPDSRSRMLGNGGRLYVDHGHPEYCTPETTSPADAVVWELAGDRIVAEAAAAASQQLGFQVNIHRNNTDGKGNSYGYHENVAIPRRVGWSQIERYLPTFLVTRIIYTGAGRLGIGPTSRTPGFQLSQRADFFTRISSLDTMRVRGIVNTRDEPHAAPGRWRRLHIIAGDANRNPWSSWLRLGTLGMFVNLLETDRVPETMLIDPVTAFRTVSRDLSLTAELPLVGGGSATALEIQGELLEAVRPETKEQSAIHRMWGEVLDDLATDPGATADRLDWPARLELLRAYRSRLGCPEDDSRLAAVDLAWSSLADDSPWNRLVAAGRFTPWEFHSDDPERLDVLVEQAMATPPTDTRAHTRGRLITEHPELVVAADWASMTLRSVNGRYLALPMPDPKGFDSATYPAAALRPILEGYNPQT